MDRLFRRAVRNAIKQAKLTRVRVLARVFDLPPTPRLRLLGSHRHGSPVLHDVFPAMLRRS